MDQAEGQATRGASDCPQKNSYKKLRKNRMT